MLPDTHMSMLKVKGLQVGVGFESTHCPMAFVYERVEMQRTSHGRKRLGLELDRKTRAKFRVRV